MRNFIYSANSKPCFGIRPVSCFIRSDHAACDLQTGADSGGVMPPPSPESQLEYLIHSKNIKPS